MALLIALAGGDVNDCRDAAAMLCGKTAGEHFYIADGFRFKNRKQADGVEGVINGDPIKQDAVLHRRAAPDVQLPTLVAGYDHAWQYGEVLCNIRFAPGRRQGADLFRRDHYFRYLDIRTGLFSLA